jgi:hypothetical protein
VAPKGTNLEANYYQNKDSAGLGCNDMMRKNSGGFDTLP